MRPPVTTTRARWVRALVLLVVVVAGLAIVLRVTRVEAPDTASDGRVTVAAAASLTDVFAAMRETFESDHTGARVTITSGSSSALAAQILGGAPVDVFASADAPTMDRVTDASMVEGAPAIFATNSLRMIVRKGNPQHITSLDDLARAGVVYVTCGPDVPIGRYASQVLAAAGVDVAPRSFESDVRGIVTKVASGEADAGIVYATDVAAAKGAVTGVDIPSSVNVMVSYPIARLRNAANASDADAWIEFVRSPRGRAILESFGFGAP